MKEINKEPLPKGGNLTDDIIEVELLAPARNAEVAVAAINHGADAVYMGASSHGARQQASNSISDIRGVVEYAHRFGVKVYVTVNTIIYDEELAGVEKLVWELYGIGVDALIVQDMALLEMKLPPIALHASTQCDIRTPEKARFLQDAGFSQLVLPRELSADEIRKFREAVDVPLEAFVHGALCVSYSGDCQASFIATGRSANRGECAQICRYAFDLEDETGRKLVRGKHLLSLKDMNRLDYLSDMLEAGVSSFKIEGRLKDAAYVKNVVAAYSRALDRIVSANPRHFRRASRGRVEYGFEPDVAKSFNRGFTSYFLKGGDPAAGSLASVDSPKWTGERIGVVKRVVSNRIMDADLDSPLENGDGLGFFNDAGVYCGFRLNRVDGSRLFAASDIEVRPGMELYRNFDKKWSDVLASGKSARRYIPLSMLLRKAGGMLVLELCDGRGHDVAASVEFECQPAKSPQAEARQRVLSKLGDTEFALDKLTDRLGDVFVPASVLTTLRRDAVAALSATYQAAYKYDYRRGAVRGLRLPQGFMVSRHDNIANRLSEKFYRNIGADADGGMPRAVEVELPGEARIRVMQTRYCLRRELGCCLKTENASRLPAKLYLATATDRFRLQFDCAACRMNVYSLRSSKG